MDKKKMNNTKNGSSNKKNNFTPFIITIIVLVIAIIAILVYNIVANRNYTGEDKVVIDKETGEVVSGETLELYSMEEPERIKYYFNKYIDCLENKDYETIFYDVGDGISISKKR